MARERGSKDVAAERKRAIVDMVNAGLAPKQVAMYYNMSPSTVRSIQHRYRRKGTVNGVHSRGRKQNWINEVLDCCCRMYERIDLSHCML